jgi:hypothetical protein
MDFHSAVPITQVLSSSVSMLRNARDLAKESGNSELKGVINQLFDTFSELKERMLSMEDEITNFKTQLTKKAAITGPVAPFGYFYKNGDAEHPLCPKCYQEKGHEYMLTTEHFNGSVSRVCRCGWSAEEAPAEAVGQIRLGRMTRRR